MKKLIPILFIISILCVACNARNTAYADKPKGFFTCDYVPVEYDSDLKNVSNFTEYEDYEKNTENYRFYLLDIQLSNHTKKNIYYTDYWLLDRWSGNIWMDECPPGTPAPDDLEKGQEENDQLYVLIKIDDMEPEQIEEIISNLQIAVTYLLKEPKDTKPEQEIEQEAIMLKYQKTNGE